LIQLKVVGFERELPMVEGECKHCGKAFAVKRDWQRFCCTECQQAFNQRRYRQQQKMELQEVLKMAGVAPSNGSFNRRV
jgi:hypothetical protein